MYIYQIVMFLNEMAIFHPLLDKPKHLCCRFHVSPSLTWASNPAVCGDHGPPRHGPKHQQCQVMFTKKNSIAQKWTYVYHHDAKWYINTGGIPQCTQKKIGLSWTLLSRSVEDQCPPGRRRQCRQWFAPGVMNDSSFWAQGKWWGCSNAWAL